MYLRGIKIVRYDDVRRRAEHNMRAEKSAEEASAAQRGAGRIDILLYLRHAQHTEAANCRESTLSSGGERAARIVLHYTVSMFHIYSAYTFGKSAELREKA